MNKNKFLLSLIIFQGILIVMGIIVIFYTIYYKIQNNDNNIFLIPSKVINQDILLLDEENIQIKKVIDNKIIFEIYNLEKNQITKILTIDEK